VCKPRSSRREPSVPIPLAGRLLWRAARAAASRTAPGTLIPGSRTGRRELLSITTTLAARLGLARQKVNYHVKTLEQHGLVELVEERRKGNMTERVVRASATAYVISPAALAAVAPDPARSPDRLSARWLLALAARLVRETGALINGAARANKPLATFGLDAEVRFARPADRAAFVGELTDAITGIISKYQTETGRPHRLIVAVHPSITEDADPPAEEQQQS
jgi:DNA-binding transcriptional ArsR family regulator